MTDALVEAARAVQRRAYAPYSQFRVGCALETDDGRVFVGCNVENAGRLRRAVVVTDADPPAAPCGACRQVLFEFGRDLRVDGVGPSGTVSWTMAQLLPSAFGPEQLA